jgi:hypothetical protein
MPTRAKKGAIVHNEPSLELYYYAIHILLSLLSMRSTAVITAYCPLFSRNIKLGPKARREHLNDCAGLIETVSINGFSKATQTFVYSELLQLHSAHSESSKGKKIFIRFYVCIRIHEALHRSAVQKKSKSLLGPHYSGASS